MSRERLHHAIDTSDMGWSDIKTKDIDWITAMGFAERCGDLEQLGGDLIVIKSATRSKSLFYFPGSDLYKKAETAACLALSKISRHHKDIKKLRRDQRDCLAELAITEWIYDACPPCNGTGAMKREDGTVVITCITCKGSKKRRYSDRERIDVMRNRFPDATLADLKSRYQVSWERALMVLRGVIGIAERAYERKNTAMGGAIVTRKIKFEGGGHATLEAAGYSNWRADDWKSDLEFPTHFEFEGVDGKSYYYDVVVDPADPLKATATYRKNVA